MLIYAGDIIITDTHPSVTPPLIVVYSTLKGTCNSVHFVIQTEQGAQVIKGLLSQGFQCFMEIAWFLGVLQRNKQLSQDLVQRPSISPWLLLSRFALQLLLMMQ